MLRKTKRSPAALDIVSRDKTLLQEYLAQRSAMHYDYVGQARTLIDKRLAAREAKTAEEAAVAKAKNEQEDRARRGPHVQEGSTAAEDMDNGEKHEETKRELELQRRDEALTRREEEVQRREEEARHQSEAVANSPASSPPPAPPGEIAELKAEVQHSKAEAQRVKAELELFANKELLHHTSQDEAPKPAAKVHRYSKVKQPVKASKAVCHAGPKPPSVSESGSELEEMALELPGIAYRIATLEETCSAQESQLLDLTRALQSLEGELRSERSAWRKAGEVYQREARKLQHELEVALGQGEARRRDLCARYYVHI